MLKDRKELEEKLAIVIKNYNLKRKNNRHLKDIKKHLLEHHEIFEGDVQSWVNDPENELPELDLRELFLLTEQIFAKTEDFSIIPSEYFTEPEMKEARQYSGLLKQKEQEISFPLTITNAAIVGNGAYLVVLDIKVINKLLENQLLDYNFDLQREATYVKRKDKIMIEPTLNMNNVKEISEHLLEGTLVPTVLVFNAAPRTSEIGDELIFDAKDNTLTIAPGTRLDIVDGYHRCKGLQNALQINPDLNFNFAVLITNYSIRKAQQYQAQLAKATPISKTRMQELEANRLSDIVVQQLKLESDLQGRISQTNRIHYINRELVTYNVLADTIEEEFEMKTRADAADVGEYLVEYFNFLIGSYPEEFIYNIEEVRKISLINDNNMFVGYIVLARRMFENNISPRKVRNIIEKINFNRDNSEWVKLDILDKKGNLNNTFKLRKNIKKYFEKIELQEKTK